MKKTIITFVGVALLFCACAQKNVPISGETKTEEAFQKLSIEPGSKNAKIIGNSSDWNFRYRIPSTGNSEPRPLVIALHWGGGNSTFAGFSNCLAEPGTAAIDPFLIAPDGEFEAWSTLKNVSKIKTLVSLAKKHWNIDTSKILVTGYSNGGNGIWHFVQHHPKLFTGAIPMASGREISSKIDIPIYVIHGAKDELFSLDFIKKQVQKIKEAGSEIELSVLPELSHYMGCAYADELKKGVDWIMKRQADKKPK